MFHILTPFPNLLIYSLWAPIILRVALGYFFFMVAISRFKTVSSSEGSLATPTSWKILGVVEIILAICFVAGLGIQIDALISIILIGTALIFFQDTYYLRKYSKEALWLLLLISFSLLLSGAGLPAIDLPL